MGAAARVGLAATIALVAVMALALMGLGGSAAPAKWLGTRPLVFGPRDAEARVIVFHGLNGDPKALLIAPFGQLIRELARRYQVIDAPEPFDSAADQAAGDQAWFASDPLGHRYRLRWMRDFRRLVGWADRTYGKKRLIVAGISWGGMHAMLAACYDRQVTAFSVSSPVVNPNALTEFSSDTLNALNPNLNGCAKRLDEIPGFIGWGDADKRVGTTAVRRLLATMPRVRRCRYHGLGHASNALTESNIVNALEGQALTGCAT